MIRPLRVAHRRAVLLLAIVVPLVIRPLRVAHRRAVLLMTIVVPLVILWALWFRQLPPVEQNWPLLQP